MDLAELLYVVDEDGYDVFNKREEKIKSCIEAFRMIAASGEDPQEYIEEVLSSYDLTEDDLTDYEVMQISRLRF